jgi:hypothetical protein
LHVIPFINGSNRADEPGQSKKKRRKKMYTINCNKTVSQVMNLGKLQVFGTESANPFAVIFLFNKAFDGSQEKFQFEIICKNGKIKVRSNVFLDNGIPYLNTR